MIDYYKHAISRMDGGELAYAFYMCRTDTFGFYSNQWCQNFLDFAYRMMQSSLLWIAYFDEYDTAEEAKDIFHQLAVHSPNIPEGGAIWSTYQFYLSVSGRAFWDEWKNSGDDALYWQKLNTIFDKHGVGFNKSAFVPIQFE